MCVAKPTARSRPAANGKKLMERFHGNEEFLATHGVTEKELALLNTLSLFGNFSLERDLVFILKNIRGTKGAR